MYKKQWKNYTITQLAEIIDDKIKKTRVKVEEKKGFTIDVRKDPWLNQEYNKSLKNLHKSKVSLEKAIRHINVVLQYGTPPRTFTPI
jgi:hypothetical protein